MAQEVIELNVIRSEDQLQPEEPGPALNQSYAALPPADVGYQAWLVLAGCFVINVSIWGFTLSFGVLQDYYVTNDPFRADPSGIAAVGTTAAGLQYLLMPIFFYALQRWPVLKRYSVWVSLPLVAGGLIGASFAQNVTQLLGFQGVLFAIGGDMLFAPTITYLDEWFIRKKGLAIGIMWAGDGAGGVMMPLIMQALLSRYGFRIALRAMASGMIIVMVPLLFFLRPRLPVPPSSTVRRIDTSFLKRHTFWIMQIFNIMQAMGYFLPINYLPTFANSLGLSSQFGSLTLVMLNVASALGCVIVGASIDRMDVTSIVLAVSVGAGASVFGIWGTSTSASLLCVFSLLYGLTAGSYSTAWTGMIKKVQDRDAGADSNVVFGFLAAGRGIGSVVSGPLSETLIINDQIMGGQSAYGGQYGPLIVFSGCTALLGGFSWFARKGRLL